MAQISSSFNKREIGLILNASAILSIKYKVGDEFLSRQLYKAFTEIFDNSAK